MSVAAVFAQKTSQPQDFKLIVARDAKVRPRNGVGNADYLHHGAGSNLRVINAAYAGGDQESRLRLPIVPPKRSRRPC